MNLDMLNYTDVNESSIETFPYDDDTQILEAFLGDSQIISTAQELNKLKEATTN